METLLLNHRYRLLRLIGSGGMAVVYKAVDTLLERRVAVKVLREAFADDPAFLARFQREAQAAAKLDHPNIVTVYDVGRDGDRHYIVMEYVDGQDLKTLIRQQDRLGVSQTLDIAIQVCHGAGHAHREGVIHCDLKPQNVLVTQDGRAKVTDFGISRALSEAGLTESQTVWGSPLYFSPEQAAGEPPAPTSDVYSIGVIMYEMLTGSPPFLAEKSTALALKHIREVPPPLAAQNPQVPPGLEWIVRKVLAKEPSARYRTAEQLAHILEEYRKRGDAATGRQPPAPMDATAPPPSTDSVGQPQLEDASQAGVDWTTMVLGAIALIAVLGLVPLWWLVYQAYADLPSLPATPTPGSLIGSPVATGMAAMPDVVGRQADDAEQVLETAGLRYAFEERDASDDQAGVVLEQSPAPSTSVALGTQVTLVVGRPRRQLAMPALTSYSLELVRQPLESDGLQVVVTRVWSGQPEGTIVGQEPSAGTTLRTGDTVTLTVSGSADLPIELGVNLANTIELKRAQVHKKAYMPGDALAVTLHWRALRAVPVDYIVFVHLISANNATGPPAAQRDEGPVTPTREWVPGVEIADSHQFDIPTSQPAGTYQIRVGMYPPGEPHARLPILDAGLATVEQGSVLIAEVEIAP